MFTAPTPTSFASKQRKSSNPLQHGYSRSIIPALTNTQGVRKSVYSSVLPSGQGPLTQTVLNRNSNNSKRSTAAQQQLNASLSSAKGAQQDVNSIIHNQVSLNTQNMAKTVGHPLNPTGKIAIRCDETNTTSILVTAASPQNQSDGTALVINRQTIQKPLSTLNDDNTGLLTFLGSTKDGGNVNYSTNKNANQDAACSKDLCVSVGLLRNSLIALVEHFDNKINELTVSKSSAHCSSQRQLDCVLLQAGGESAGLTSPQSIPSRGGFTTFGMQQQQQLSKSMLKKDHGNILATIEHLIQQQANKQIKTHKDITITDKAAPDEKISFVQPDTEKENKCPIDQYSTTQKKRTIEDEDIVSQLTIAQVPPNELESARSAQVSQTSSRSFPKSSNSKKKKNENPNSKVNQPQPFRPTQNSTVATMKTSGRTKVSASEPQSVARKKNIVRKNHTNANSSQVSRSTVQSVQNPMPSLMKSNPNFGCPKNQRSSRSRSKHSPQRYRHFDTSNSSHLPSNSPGDLTAARLTGTVVQEIQCLTKPVEDQLALISSKAGSCLILNKEGSLGGHFQDIMDSSHSLLKSISREGDASQDQLLLLQQLSGPQEDRKTPCMGGKSDFLLSCEVQPHSSAAEDQQESFKVNQDEKQALATSTFKVNKPNYVEASFSKNDQKEQEAVERSQESSMQQMTPEKKANENLLKLLSNLEGLTPAGLDYLVQTQDKIATKSALQKHPDEDSLKKEKREILSQKTRNDKSIGYFSSKNMQQQQQPQKLIRANSLGMRSLEPGSVRQKPNFVEAQEGTSPTPSSLTKYTHATIDVKLQNEKAVTTKEEVYKRLVYDQLPVAMEPANRRSQQSVVTPRLSMVYSNAAPAPVNRTAYNQKRQKSTKGGQSRNTAGSKNDLLALKPLSVLDSRRQNFAGKQSQIQQNNRNQVIALGVRGNQNPGAQKQVTPRVNSSKQQQNQASQAMNTGANGRSPNNYSLQKKTSVEVLKQNYQNLTARGQQQQCQQNLANTDRAQTSSLKDVQISVLHPDQQVDNDRANSQASSKVSTNQQAVTQSINDAATDQQKNDQESTHLALNKTQQQSETAREKIIDHPHSSLSSKVIIPMTQSTRSLTSMAEPLPQNQLLAQYYQNQNYTKKGSKTAKSLSSSQSVYQMNPPSRLEDRFKQLSRLVEQHQSNLLEQTQKSSQLKSSSTYIDLQHQSTTFTTKTTAHTPQLASAKSSAILAATRKSLWRPSSKEVLENYKNTETTLKRQENEKKIESEQFMSSPEAVQKQGEFRYKDEKVIGKVAEAGVKKTEDARKSFTSEKVPLKNRSIFSNEGATLHKDQLLLCGRRQTAIKQQRMSVASSNDKVERKSAATDKQKENLGSFEQKIQQIEISQELFQQMDIDYRDINIAEAGHVFEPSDDNPYCEMLRPSFGEDEYNPYSIGEFLRSAHEMEPSCMIRMQPLNLSIEEHEQLPMSTPQQTPGSPPTMHNHHFEQNTSNVSFG